MNDSFNYQLYSLLDRIRKEVRQCPGTEKSAEWIEEIDQQLIHVSSNSFQVAMVGEFKRGKSSLINTLLQSDVLPADILPTTATFNRVVYGKTPKAHLRMKDQTIHEIPIDDLKRYITKISEESLENARQIEEAVVEFPSMFCSNHVELIDTPGLNDNDEMTQLTVSRLKDIDLAIVTVSVLYPFSMTEADFVAQLLETSSVCKILFAITMTDTVDASELELAKNKIEQRIQQSVLKTLQSRHEDGDPVMEKYNQLIAVPQTFLLSAKKAKKALQLQNENLYMESGYRHFTEVLPGILLEGQQKGIAEQSLRVAESVLTRCLEYYGFYGRLENLRNQVKEGKKRFAELAYSLVDLRDKTGSEHQLMLNAIHDACESLKAQKATIESLYTQAWQQASEDQQERMLAILNAMPKVYQTLNEQFEQAFSGELYKRIAEAENAGMNSVLPEEPLLPSMPELETEIRDLWASVLPGKEIMELAEQQAGNAPFLFRWTQPPFPSVFRQYDEFFLERTCAAASVSFDDCLNESETCLVQFAAAFAGQRRKQVESIVMKAFVSLNQREKELLEEMEKAKQNQLPPEQIQSFEQMMQECRALWLTIRENA